MMLGLPKIGDDSIGDRERNKEQHEACEMFHFIGPH